MAYDERLADRVRAALAGQPGISERKMFGGLCFMVDEKMFLGVMTDHIMCRVGPSPSSSGANSMVVSPRAASSS